MSRKLRGKCPVCSQVVNLKEQICAAKNKMKVPWFSTYEYILDHMSEGSAHDPHSDRKIIHWACNSCIENGRALLADTGKQTFCDCYPYLAYFTEKRICEKCNKEYLFTKEEQIFWYETLKFWVQSRPKKCKFCYYKERKKKTPSSLALEIQNITDLTEAPPSERNYDRIRETLNSKWEEVRNHAIFTLSKWGDDQSKDILKSVMMDYLNNPNKWTSPCEIIKGLTKCLKNKEDISWLLDLMFSIEGFNYKYDLLKFIINFPLSQELQNRIIAECHSNDPDNRKTAMYAIAMMPFSEQETLLRTFLKDPDESIQKDVKKLLGSS